MLVREKMGWMLRDWLDRLPSDIRATVEKYPPGKYRIKKDAPYSITAPGCLVAVIDYKSATRAYVTIVKGTPEAHAQHAAKLRAHGKILSEQPIEGICAVVDIAHLELVEVAPGIKEAWNP